MDHAETSPDHVAKVVFWTIAIACFAFIVGVVILIR